MKRAVIVVMACCCLFPAVWPVTASASSITPVFQGVGWTSGQEDIVGAAITAWTNLLSIPQDIWIYFRLADLAGNTLGQTSNFYVWIPSYLPALATITIDTGAWISWNLGGPVNGQYDALSILTHEVGHAIGFAYVFPDFQNHVTYDGQGNPYFDTYSLYKQSYPSHLNDANDLMYPYLQSGRRYEPSSADADILHIAFGYPQTHSSPIGNETTPLVPLPAAVFLFAPALAGLAAMRGRLGR